MTDKKPDASGAMLIVFFSPASGGQSEITTPSKWTTYAERDIALYPGGLTWIPPGIFDKD